MRGPILFVVMLLAFVAIVIVAGIIFPPRRQHTDQGYIDKIVKKEIMTQLGESGEPVFTGKMPTKFPAFRVVVEITTKDETDEEDIKEKITQITDLIAGDDSVDEIKALIIAGAYDKNGERKFIVLESNQE